MAVPKILVIPGSLRARSHNVRLAALATKELTLADADVTRISLADYPLPIYDADAAEESAPPHNAVKLKQLMSAHQGIFIASPAGAASGAGRRLPRPGDRGAGNGAECRASLRRDG